MATWYLDSGLSLDEDYRAEAFMEWEAEFSEFSFSGGYDANEVVMEWEGEMEVFYSVALDLKDLVPEKFFSYSKNEWEMPGQILVDYLDEAGLFVGDWMTKVRDMVKLLSPNTSTSIAYMRLLGSIIGVQFPPEDQTTEEEMRKNLEYAVEWYAQKGTYYAIQIIGIINQLTLQVYDMYTNDYVNFYMTDWWTGGEGENPTGFDSTYYKSPHFGVEILLNKVYLDGSLNYLWLTNKLGNLALKIEETRPVHTVPHCILKLNPVTDEFGNVITVAGEIKTKVMTSWQVANVYLDDGKFFDDSLSFDQSSETYIKSITKWVLGTNYPCNINDTGFVIEGAVLEGTIDPENLTIGTEKITFEFLIPKAIVQDDISSLGLYIPNTSSGDELVLGSCFPKIDKDDQVELRIVVEVYKKDLS